MKLRTILSKAVLPSLLAITASTANAAVVAFVGADTTTSGDWRTATTVKALDADGNNRYGTDGYLVIGTPTVQPSYATAAPAAGALTFAAGSDAGVTYTFIDNPAGGPDFETGVIYKFGTIPDENQSLAVITVGSASSFRLGVMIDNSDVSLISPGMLQILQTAGSGAGNSGLIGSQVEGNLDTDWYFFDITGALPGDTFTVFGTNIGGSLPLSPEDSNGIGGLTFDTIPEPTTASLGLIGALALLRRRRA
ncbi:MAG: hypothetical protein H7Y43_11375 [Akkermansiaceae bacterium]|nr:hypothetical protein [Verrucomicrobiales bacterium]